MHIKGHHPQSISASASNQFLTLSAEVERISAFGDEIQVHFGGRQTGGRFTMFSAITPPGGGPPPHFHMEEDEWFYLLEGRVEYLTNDVWTEVPAGTVAFMPKNSLHTFRNPGSVPLKQMLHTAPSGFEIFFKKAELECQRPGGPEMQQLFRIAAEHDIFFPTLDPSSAAKRKEPAFSPTIVRPGEGRTCRMFGEEVTILLEGHNTGGRITAFIEVTQPGGGPPPHVLAEQDEWLFVLEGHMSFFYDGKWIDAPEGTTLFAPRGSAHTFKNVGDAPSRMLVNTSPSGIEKFFDAVHDEFARPDGPDMNRAMKLAGEHGIRFV